eukprot:gnl/Dysnectes_brevis/4105_a5395_1049.p1 GENE.gnl/Dysnectes_brevis/4105_a5395_1049~~gnl/Dysnectes_brevis/4105_a5395_1049.p1  ORF type:complete len:266 (+),score=15.91 gnl/Dysnectes_brevis/4105_a5395_1049:99-896(+)
MQRLRGDPAKYIDKVILSRIYRSEYYRKYCFGLDEETLCDRAADLKYVGIQYSAKNLPTPFASLLVTLIQLNPSNDIISIMLEQPDFKYLTILISFYQRLISPPSYVYRSLEPLLMDYRRVATRSLKGWKLTTVDQIIWELLTQTISTGLALPRLPKRSLLHRTLKTPRLSPFQALPRHLLLAALGEAAASGAADPATVDAVAPPLQKVDFPPSGFNAFELDILNTRLIRFHLRYPDLELSDKQMHRQRDMEIATGVALYRIVDL